PGTSATAARTDAARLSPPGTTDVSFPSPSSSARRMVGSSQPSGTATTMPSTQPVVSSRSRLSASSTRLPSGANAFGRVRPGRRPRRDGGTTAQPDPPGPCVVLGGGLDALLRLVRVGEDTVEPLGGLLLVHALRVHELGHEDLLRLHEHLLLARGEALVLVAEREVPHHLGELEDVAGLHLLAVVLEAAVSVLLPPLAGSRPGPHPPLARLPLP